MGGLGRLMYRNFFAGLLGRGLHDQDGTIVGHKSRAVIQVKIFFGQAVRHGPKATGFVGDLDRHDLQQRDHESVGTEVADGQLAIATRNFITPLIPDPKTSKAFIRPAT